MTETMSSNAPAPATRVVPTISQPVRIPWGDWAEQGLIHEAALIEQAAQLGFDLAARATPLGGIVQTFVGPTVVKQLVDQGLKLAEGMVHGQEITITEPNWVEAYVVTTFNQLFPTLFAKVGTDLTPMLTKAIAAATPVVPPVVPGNNGKIGSR